MSSSPSAPLAGTVVIELGHSVAAPFAAQILCDLGAEVIKLEKPGGDDARKWGPPFVDGASATFQSLNRGKRSVTGDLRDPGFKAKLLRLIHERADVVLQNMRPGQVSELGLDADTLRATKPGLVYCNLGAFGYGGPLSDRPGYDPLMQAFGGIMSVTGEPGRPPVRVGPSMIDMGSGMWAVLGIVCALMRRRETGEGGVVDVSLFETAATWMTIHASMFLASGEQPAKHGSGQTGIVPYRAYRTADGDLVVAAGNDGLFRQLSQVLGEPGWPDDPRFRDNPSRVANADVLYAMIEERFAKRTNAEWGRLLDAAGVPCAPAQTVGQMLEHPQTQALGIVRPVAGSSIPMIGLPLRLDGTRPGALTASPTLGEASIDDLLAAKP